MGNLSLSSLSSLSLNESLTPSTKGEETSSEDSWAEVLGSDWQGRGMLGSDTSFDSELGVNDDSDIPKLISQGYHGSDSSSNSSGYSGNAESSFESDMLEMLDDEDADEESSGDHWAQLRKWVCQNIREMYESHYEMPCNEIHQGSS